MPQQKGDRLLPLQYQWIGGDSNPWGDFGIPPEWRERGWQESNLRQGVDSPSIYH